MAALPLARSPIPPATQAKKVMAFHTFMLMMCRKRTPPISGHQLACVADETKPRYSPSANQRPKACSAPRVLPGFSIIGSNWLLHMAVLSRAVIGRVDPRGTMVTLSMNTRCTT